MQVVPALLPALHSDSWQAQEAAVGAVKGLIRQTDTALQAWLKALLPALVQAACSSRPQVQLLTEGQKKLYYVRCFQCAARHIQMRP